MKNPGEIASALSQWFRNVSRPLPWRKKYEPYSIWLSEIMLQQTQVTTVIPYYEKFLSAFPTIESLAKADEVAILRLWAGLGYYSRARNLIKGARFIVDNHGGKFPTDREVILTVPGVGPYTAGAILSIAFDLPEAIVDGNVERVLSRFYAIEAPLGSTASKKKLWELADEWVRSAESPRILNQAMMELGSLVCIKGSPRCEQCPIEKGCIAKKMGLTETLPVPKVRPPKKQLHWIQWVLQTEDSIFLKRNQPSEWWHGLWDFPRVEISDVVLIETNAQKWAQKFPSPAQVKEHPSVKHTVTHHAISVYPHSVQLKRRWKPAEWNGEWIKKRSLKELPLSSLASKVLAALEF